MSTFATVVQHFTGFVSQKKQLRERNERYLNQEEKVKLFLFPDDIIPQRENNKEFMEKNKLLEPTVNLATLHSRSPTCENRLCVYSPSINNVKRKSTELLTIMSKE